MPSRRRSSSGDAPTSVLPPPGSETRYTYDSRLGGAETLARPRRRRSASRSRPRACRARTTFSISPASMAARASVDGGLVVDGQRIGMSSVTAQARSGAPARGRRLASSGPAILSTASQRAVVRERPDGDRLPSKPASAAGASAAARRPDRDRPGPTTSRRSLGRGHPRITVLEHTLRAAEARRAWPLPTSARAVASAHRRVPIRSCAAPAPSATRRQSHEARVAEQSSSSGAAAGTPWTPAGTGRPAGPR